MCTAQNVRKHFALGKMSMLRIDKKEMNEYMTAVEASLQMFEK